MACFYHPRSIFHDPISITVDPSDRTNPSSTPTDVDLYLSVREKARIAFKLGTEAGNTEGSAFANVYLRNLFGGAESLSLNVAQGTRTRTAYQGTFEAPILANPDFRGEVGALASSTQKTWASHEEVLKAGWTKLRWLARGGKHELGYSGIWRQVTGLAEKASPTVRGDAGDSVKSSITYSVTNDQRDYPLLPQSGYLTKSTLELAGWGPLQGDVAFGKAEMEGQGAIPIPIPGVKGNSGVSFTTGFRTGLMYPLPLGFDSNPQPSRINDRFQLGGPTDVRGFRLGGLGPSDGNDAVGGDVYAAGSANLLMPLPRLGPEKPFRIQAFINGGRLLALKQSESEKMDAGSVRHSVSSTVAELGNGLPSMAAGVGLVYGHPVARFELNFSLPLVIRKGGQRRPTKGPKPHKDPTDAPQRQAAEGGTSWYIDSRPGHDVCHDKAAHRPQTPTPQNLVCFGCDREFYSYASMILHLEEGECITTMAELARIAESASYSDRYIVYGWREYLRTEYGLEKTAFDTDNETVWECVECRKVFYTLSKASVHARSAAHKPRLFKCPSCPKDFNALSGLLQHVEQSNSCPEGLYKGTRVMGRLLSEIGDRMVEKDNHKLEPESSSASMAPAE
ncbi:MAG: hypothetical protein LQ343_001079 [Gyalolechia ehrenbergii]|nr:MAG: hypothetical protein LQ343_001079 [Gyalolechia ehrenbergii]